MSLHIHHDSIVGVYCHGVWYECVKGSFTCDSFEVQVYGDKHDIDLESYRQNDWVFMCDIHSEVPHACTGASWIDPKTNERLAVFMYDIKGFRESL